MGQREAEVTERSPGHAINSTKFLMISPFSCFSGVKRGQRRAAVLGHRSKRGAKLGYR